MNSFMKGGTSSFTGMTFGLVGKIGGFEAMVGGETCLFFSGLAKMELSTLRLLLFGLPGQLRSINGSDIGTELFEAVEDGGEARLSTDENRGCSDLWCGEMGGVNVFVTDLIISGDDRSVFLANGFDLPAVASRSAVEFCIGF